MRMRQHKSEPCSYRARHNWMTTLVPPSHNSFIYIQLRASQTVCRQTRASGAVLTFRWPFACIPLYMRPLMQTTVKVKSIRAPENCGRPTLAVPPFLITLAAGAQGCGGGESVGNPPPPPPQSIIVTVTPVSGSVLLGNLQTLSAQVTNATDTTGTWSVNGVPGGSASIGTITAGGVYSAPGDLPSPTTVRITATSHADTMKSASAQLTIASHIAIALAPPNVAVELGAGQGFHAASPAQAIRTRRCAGASQRCGMPSSLRRRGPRRQLHGARGSPVHGNRDAHRAECRRSIEAILRCYQHHQQFPIVAAITPISPIRVNLPNQPPRIRSFR
jgi:hypothetical protein